MNGLLEILTNKQWMIRPEFVHGIRSVIQNNLNNHIELGEEKEHEMGCRIVFTREGVETRITEERYSAKDGRYISSWNENKDDPFINVMFVDGPITRNGGACSYGSVEHRDMMMKAADNANCVGHIFHINTPGGSAWAKNDYQQAINYARSKKQPVVAFIDGMCASAGMYLAALCDNRYFMHPKDEIGCIGVMAAFYTEANGSKNEYTNETYHELYDPESFDKNKEFRDIANDANDELLIAELAKLGVQFRADVKAACPKATDEHLHGKVFDAEEVVGILMDGQKTLGEVFNVVIDKGVKNGLQSAKNAYNMLNPNNNVTNMKEKFPSLFAALAVEEMQMTEEGAFMNMDLLATLNAKIEAMTKEAADAKALAESLTAEKEALTAAHEQAITELKAANDKAVEDLNAEHTAAIEAKDAEIKTLTENAGKADETMKAKDDEIAQLKSDMEGQKAQVEQLQADVDGAKASIETASATIAEKDNLLAERDQQIQDLNARIAELENDPGAGAQAGAAPKDNGAGAEAPKIAATTPVAKPGQTYEEMRETWKGDK